MTQRIDSDSKLDKPERTKPTDSFAKCKFFPTNRTHMQIKFSVDDKLCQKEVITFNTIKRCRWENQISLHNIGRYHMSQRSSIFLSYTSKTHLNDSTNTNKDSGKNLSKRNFFEIESETSETFLSSPRIDRYVKINKLLPLLVLSNFLLHLHSDVWFLSF